MRFLRVTIFLTILAHPVWAEQPYSLVSTPSCTNNRGETVQFKNIQNQIGKSASGMAKRDEMGAPVIFRFSYQKSPPSLQHFIDLHECAHHQTGDVDRPHPKINSPEHMMNESIADCVAALRIRDGEGLGRKIALNAVEELTKAMQIVGFPTSTTESRASNILNCLNEATSADTFVDRVLKSRGLK